MVTLNPRTNTGPRKASATKVAARGSAEMVAPAGKPVVRTIKPISETPQQSNTRAPIPEASIADAVREEAEQVTQVAAEPAVTVIDAISKAFQQPRAIAQPQGASAPEVAVRDAVEQVSPAAAKPVVSTTSAIDETIKTSVDTVASVAEAVVEPIAPTEMTTTKPPQGINTMIKTTEDFVALGQANMEALAKSGQIWTAGVQELMKQFAETTKATFDETVATFKAISSAKSVTEAMDLQSKFATSAAGRALSESNKLVTASITLTEQTLTPLTARMTTALGASNRGA
jgi:phasin family protein